MNRVGFEDIFCRTLVLLIFWWIATKLVTLAHVRSRCLDWIFFSYWNKQKLLDGRQLEWESNALNILVRNRNSTFKFNRHNSNLFMLIGRFFDKEPFRRGLHGPRRYLNFKKCSNQLGNQTKFWNKSMAVIALAITQPLSTVIKRTIIPHLLLVLKQRFGQIKQIKCNGVCYLPYPPYDRLSYAPVCG